MATITGPYKYKVTAAALDGLGTGYVVTYQIQDNASTVLATQTAAIEKNLRELPNLRDALLVAVRTKEIADAGGVALWFPQFVTWGGVL